MKVNRWFSIKKIVLPSSSGQWCLMKGNRTDIALACDACFTKTYAASCSSDLFVDQQLQVFLKGPPVKSFWVDNLSKLVCWTSADRETRGNFILRGFGIPTVQIIASAVPLNPFNPYRSLLYCRLLEDVTPLDEYLRLNPERVVRRKILDSVAEQLSILLHNGVYFRDFYFGNLLYSSQGQLYWIDTEVQYYRFRKRKPLEKFLKKKQFMYERFLRGGGDPDEWKRFLDVLLKA